MDFTRFAEDRIVGTEFDAGGFYELPRLKNGKLMSYEEVLQKYYALSDEEREALPTVDEDTGEINFGPEPVTWRYNWEKFLAENIDI